MSLPLLIGFERFQQLIKILVCWEQRKSINVRPSIRKWLNLWPSNAFRWDISSLLFSNTSIHHRISLQLQHKATRKTSDYDLWWAQLEVHVHQKPTAASVQTTLIREPLPCPPIARSHTNGARCFREPAIALRLPLFLIDIPTSIQDVPAKSKQS